MSLSAGAVDPMSARLTRAAARTVVDQRWFWLESLGTQALQETEKPQQDRKPRHWKLRHEGPGNDVLDS